MEIADLEPECGWPKSPVMNRLMRYFPSSSHTSPPGDGKRLQNTALVIQLPHAAWGDKVRAFRLWSLGVPLGFIPSFLALFAFIFLIP